MQHVVLDSASCRYGEGEHNALCKMRLNFLNSDALLSHHHLLSILLKIMSYPHPGYALETYNHPINCRAAYLG